MLPSLNHIEPPEMEDSDEQRAIELSSLSAIFPEIQQVNDDDPYTFFLDVPVNPSKGVLVSFPAAAIDGAPPPAHGDIAALHNDEALNRNNEDSEEQLLSYLPAVRLQIGMPPGYPAEEPPSIAISTSPPWLPDHVVRRLQDDASRLWEELGRGEVIFTYVDHIQQSVEDLFGLVNEKNVLQLELQHKISILDFDIKAKRAAFERETFECGVCLDPKKGSACHRMMDCGHVFCVECLQDFYYNAIKEGDLATVRCLAPGCAKEREQKAAEDQKARGKKIRTFISPSELLQIPLELEVVQRYVSLKYKTELESDKDTIYCPRSWCQGAARSKKHKKPQGLELAEASDDDSDAENVSDATNKALKSPARADLVAICEDCGFAFCSRCFQTWHGEFYVCQPSRNKDEVSVEEQASLEYMRLYSTPCPTCGVRAQKTHGCNHMICYRCRSHFCYLCAAWLSPNNPYAHYNEAPDGMVTPCYMRLWELEEGDGENVGAGDGIRQPAPQPQQQGHDEPVPMNGDLIDNLPREPVELEVVGEAVVPGPQPRNAENPNENNRAGQNGQPLEVAREGPLVLRIAGNQPAGAGARGGVLGGQVAPPPAAPAAPARGGRQGHLRGGQAGARGGRGGRGGGGGPVNRGAPQPQNNRGGRAMPHRHNAAPAAPAHGYGRVNGNHGPHNGFAGRVFAELEEDDIPVNLNAAQRAWIRQFVELALNDHEDELDSDDD